MALAAVHHGLGLIPNTISGMVFAHEPTRNWPKGTPARATCLMEGVGLNCPAFNRQAETKLGQDAIVYRRVAQGGRGFVSNHIVSLHLLLEVALDTKI